MVAGFWAEGCGGPEGCRAWAGELPCGARRIGVSRRVAGRGAESSWAWRGEFPRDGAFAALSRLSREGVSERRCEEVITQRQ